MIIKFTGIGVPFRVYESADIKLQVEQTADVSDELAHYLLTTFGPAFIRVTDKPAFFGKKPEPPETPKPSLDKDKSSRRGGRRKFRRKEL
jgi:hypothetical protein